MKQIKFKKVTEDSEFLKTLRKRVNQYFRENNLVKTSNTKAKIKALILLLVYVTCYLGIFLSQDIAHLITLYVMLGPLSIFLALNIAHDAAHGTFSSTQRINNILLYTFDFLGANGYMWKLKHVFSHHPHVNIPGMDADIRQSNLVRVFPNSPFLFFHRFQYLYMPILYLMYTLVWFLWRDYKDFFKTNISGRPDIAHSSREYIKLFLGKAIFLIRLILLPTILTAFSVEEILLGFMLSQFTASFTVALALISTHVGEHSIYPEPDTDGNMGVSWVKHQLITTTDFSTNSRLITGLFGGFNHHVVHHLFPNICHIHYPQVTKILVATCEEFNMPYASNTTLVDAVTSHLKFLKERSVANKAVPYLEEL